ncbi:hypothetical protein C8F01DRAFT_1171503 [Mycena amicta]|nr:hypothetical protein C8F01DRAFT_1171503 [Mycena amicta]
MVDLPLELIELIVDQLPDDDSLRLWSSLRLGSWRPWRTYTEIAAILDACPHLAGYVTKVSISLHRWANEVVTESVLRRLTHLREVTIAGRPDFSKEDALVAEVLDRILNTLRAHGTMTQLALRHVRKLPLDVMHRILITAPSLDLVSTSVELSPSIPSASGSLPRSRPTESLRLRNSGTVARLLLLPEFAPYYANSLKNLSSHVNQRLEGSNVALCFLAAQTLESIVLHFLNYTLSHDLGSVLPSHVPCLRHLTLGLPARHGVAWIPPPCLINVLFPSCAPVLACITLDLQGPKESHHFPIDYTRIFHPDVLMELDDASSAHPALERLHWCIYRHLGSHPTNLDTVSAALRPALPASSAKGLLVIEICWNPVRFPARSLSY